MADGTSGAEPLIGLARAGRVARPVQGFGTIVVVGGGCYGGYFVRQLGRAAAAGAVVWERLVVVDRDPRCAVARLPAAERPRALRLEVDEWAGFFERWLGDAAAAPERHRDDAIVPSPLMPHLMADWLLARAQGRWAGRAIDVRPLGTAPELPWQRAGTDGTHYVSFADWMCPVNCVEPARCPHTRGVRSWSMPDAIGAHARLEAAESGVAPAVCVFHCAHRAYGVGMIDVRDVLAADAAVARTGDAGGEFLVGTASHCHGAVRRIVVGPRTKRPAG